MADDDYNETPADDIPGRNKKNGGTLVTLAIFGAGIMLLVALLYFAY